MSEANANVFNDRNRNVIIIAVTIVVLAIIIMYFWDRQQKHNLELERLETQGEVWQEWGPPQQSWQQSQQQQQNRQPNKAPGKKGRIL